jgi:hypothetical protein
MVSDDHPHLLRGGRGRSQGLADGICSAIYFFQILITFDSIFGRTSNRELAESGKKS